MTSTTIDKQRISSIDLLRGLIMILMALDHVRHFLHDSAYIFDPTDLEKTSPAIFLTRWITHYCAPLFCFLAGLSAALSGRQKSISSLSASLFKRGLWLIFMELTVIGFGWHFNIGFNSNMLAVFWALGMGMVCLSALIYLPFSIQLGFGLLLICGHNLLDGIPLDGNVIWNLLHAPGNIPISKHMELFVGYPLIPWVAVISLGYCFGALYLPGVDAAQRKSVFAKLGFGLILVFLILRASNFYGNPRPWMVWDSAWQTAFDFINLAKYPPSFLYLCMTLGPCFLFLAYSENWKGKWVDWISVFGRVPFFYYLMHIYLIHLIGAVAAEWMGFGWRKMIMVDWQSFEAGLQGFGFSLGPVYLIWLAVVLLLFPFCRRFDAFKMRHKGKWWIPYV